MMMALELDTSTGVVRTASDGYWHAVWDALVLDDGKYVACGRIRCFMWCECSELVRSEQQPCVHLRATGNMLP